MHNIQFAEQGAIAHHDLYAHLSPKAQVKNALALDLPLRLDLHHTSVLIRRHDSYVHAKCISNRLKGHMITPCA